MREIDANILAIALAGSSDELVDKFCGQMPKQTGRAFRREIRRLGPMRLSDVETAQRAVADHVARSIAQRRTLATAHK
jgi:flagellar motor switch protein FliG